MDSATTQTLLFTRSERYTNGMRAFSIFTLLVFGFLYFLPSLLRWPVALAFFVCVELVFLFHLFYLYYTHPLCNLMQMNLQEDGEKIAVNYANFIKLV